MCSEEAYEELKEEMAEIKATVADGMHRFDKFLRNHKEEHEEHQALVKACGEMVDAWNTAGGVVKFIKWLAGIMAACAAIYASIQAFLSGWRPH